MRLDPTCGIARRARAVAFNYVTGPQHYQCAMLFREHLSGYYVGEG